MPIIDADTHVDETEDTWDYMLPGEQPLKPTVGYPSNPDPTRAITRYWVVDGERHPRFSRSDEKTHTTVQTRELLDVKARLRDMDAMGVQHHVIYPTLFLVQPTQRPETDLAIKRSYNRWLGHRCDESGGRLRWVCLPPAGDMQEAVKELRWAKEHGCVGVLKKGDREAGKWVDDEYFFPMYKEAESLNLPLCFHIGSGTFDRVPGREFISGAFLRLRMPVLHAFQSLVAQKVPQQFPRLRCGFIEAGAGWVPDVLYTLARRLAKPGEGAFGSKPPDYAVGPNLLKDLGLFVTCQVDEDLPYIIKFTGEDSPLVGSDYTHADQSQQEDFEVRLRARAGKGDISRAAVEKMLYDNPKRLYGL